MLNRKPEYIRISLLLKNIEEDVYLTFKMDKDVHSISLRDICDEISWFNTARFKDDLFRVKRFKSGQIYLFKTADKMVEEYQKTTFELIKEALGINFIALLDENQEVKEQYASYGVPMEDGVNKVYRVETNVDGLLSIFMKDM